MKKKNKLAIGSGSGSGSGSGGGKSGGSGGESMPNLGNSKVGVNEKSEIVLVIIFYFILFYSHFLDFNLITILIQRDNISEVPSDVKAAQKELREQALLQKLKEIDMSQHDATVRLFSF